MFITMSQCHNVKMSRYVYHKTDSSIPIEWMSSWSEHADSLIFSVVKSNMNSLCILPWIRIWRSSSLQNYFQPRMFSIALWQSFNGRCNIQNFQLFTNFARKYHFHFLFQWFLPQTPLVKAMKMSKIHIFQTLNAIFAY